MEKRKLTHICPDIFVNIKYPEAKSCPVLANGGPLQEATAKNTQPFFVWIEEVPIQRLISAGNQNYTQLKQTRKPQ